MWLKFNSDGAQDSRFFSKITKEKIHSKCCGSGIPLGADDPQSKNDFSRLIIDLYNGAKSGTMTHGHHPLVLSQPTSLQLINKGMCNDASMQAAGEGLWS